jgi:hypothetical protein
MEAGADAAFTLLAAPIEVKVNPPIIVTATITVVIIRSITLVRIFEKNDFNI